MTNKESAFSFLNLVIAGKIREAYEKHTATNMRHHNPHHKGDALSLMKGMEEAERQFPDKGFKVKHAIGEQDYVAVHSHLTLKPGELELAVVHLFRFQDEKIVEFWDVGQQVPQESPNKNGMF